MKETTYLSDTIDGVGSANPKYDENIKKLLADKQVLARILRYCANEFQHMEVDDIILCISDDIKIGKQEVDPGRSNRRKNTNNLLTK